MKNIYIFDEYLSSQKNGIGIYLQELVYCFCSLKYNICLIVFNAKTEEFKIIKEKKIRKILFPVLKIHFVYYVDVIEKFLRLYIEDSLENVFLINHTPCDDLMESLKTYFPLSKIVFTIHDFYWTVSLMGNIDEYEKVIKKAEKETYLRNKFHYGDILIRNRKGSATEYLLCISPPCDVCRPGKVKLNICFINGLEVPEAELTVKRKENVHISVLPINNGCKTDLKYVAWRLFDIVKFDLGKKEDYESICSYSRPFMMSEQYSRQIGNLFTSYFSRAGVDELFMKSAQNLRALFK